MKPNNPVSSIMTTKLQTVRPGDSVHKVMEIFRQFGFHHIPVVDEGEKLVGIISREDFLRISYELSLSTSSQTYSKVTYRSMKVEEVMTTNPISLEPEDTIGLAADIFLANEFHALPVIEDQTIVGIVTTHDLLQYSFHSPVESEAMEPIED